VIFGEISLLAAALAVAAVLAPDADWNLPVLLILGALAILSDLRAIPITARQVKASASFLAIVATATLLGAAPALIVALATILATWVASRYDLGDLLINLVTYATFTVAAGATFDIVRDELALGPDEAGYYLLLFAVFMGALAIDFTMIAAYTAYVERSSFLTRLRTAFVPIIPTEAVSALLTLGIAFAYHQVGVAAVALFGIVLVTFQTLLRELLISQERASELEVRAKQLAGFQVALLSALLRTLDLRDRMTARHSAAVARYARELAAHAGLSEEEQELAHTAGLLHDIGKFVLPDHILKTRGRPDARGLGSDPPPPRRGGAHRLADRRYRPVGEIILAHHERMDGLGYPRGLVGEEIPVIARIIAVVDTYDAMTARDSYRAPRSSAEAIAELRRCAGSQLDPHFVELFIEMLADKDIAYRHGEDADFESELALDKRIHDYVTHGAIGI
jgi:uncharacterized domain HDIG